MKGEEHLRRMQGLLNSQANRKSEREGPGGPKGGGKTKGNRTSFVGFFWGGERIGSFEGEKKVSDI